MRGRGSVQDSSNLAFSQFCNHHDLKTFYKSSKQDTRVYWMIEPPTLIYTKLAGCNIDKEQTCTKRYEYPLVRKR